MNIIDYITIIIIITITIIAIIAIVVIIVILIIYIIDSIASIDVFVVIVVVFEDGGSFSAWKLHHDVAQLEFLLQESGQNITRQMSQTSETSSEKKQLKIHRTIPAKISWEIFCPKDVSSKTFISKYI